MRRPHLALPTADALALFTRAPSVHLAGVGLSGQPILRTLHGVVVDGAIAFHGALVGETAQLLGRPVVVAAHEQLAEVPSFIVDRERACPATTLYRAAQAKGVLARVDEPRARARVLQALMARFQPEGGHVPIDPDHPDYARLYAKPVAGVGVCRVVPDSITGKAKLAQDKREASVRALLDGLWRHGQPGVDATVELVRRTHPERPLPEFLRGPAGVELCARPGSDDVERVLELLSGTYWTRRTSPSVLAELHRTAPAWVGARSPDGQLIASARAAGDGLRSMRLHDVVVDPRWRGRGVGRAVFALLLDHPRVRACAELELATRDAEPFYATFGFVAHRPRYTQMRLLRG